MSDPIPARPSADERLADVRKKLDSADIARDVWNIATWGWVGDGKTCSILTAMHFLRPELHGLGLSLPRDSHRLQDLSWGDGWGRGEVEALIESTNQRLPRLRERFIDDSVFPHGTDDATPYLLELSRERSRLGAVYLPDLPGGHFREVEPAARAVLATADACFILVDVGFFSSSTSEAKDYRDEVRQRIYACVEAKLPAAVLLTKCDSFPGGADEQSASAVQEQVSRMICRIAGGFDAMDVFRVSVVGQAVKPDSEQAALPPASDRAPRELMIAWVWLLSKAVFGGKSGGTPPLDLQSVRREPRVEAPPILELRRVGEYSNCPGAVVGSLKHGGKELVVFASEQQLSLASFPEDGAAPEVRSAALPEELHGHRLVVRASGGRVLLGVEANATSVFEVGLASMEVVARAVASDMASWDLVDSDHVVALDGSGRLLSLGFSGGRYSPLDFVELGAAFTGNAVCAVVPGRRVLVVGSDQSFLFEVGRDGQLGARRDPGLKIGASISGRRLVADGAVVGCDADSGLLRAWTSSGTEWELGGLIGPDLYAVHDLSGSIVWLDPDSMLCLATPEGGGDYRVSVEHMPVLNPLPKSLGWRADGNVVVVAEAVGGVWSTYRVVGAR